LSANPKQPRFSGDIRAAANAMKYMKKATNKSNMIMNSAMIYPQFAATWKNPFWFQKVTAWLYLPASPPGAD